MRDKTVAIVTLKGCFFCALSLKKVDGGVEVVTREDNGYGQWDKVRKFYPYHRIENVKYNYLEDKE